MSGTIYSTPGTRKTTSPLPLACWGLAVLTCLSIIGMFILHGKIKTATLTRGVGQELRIGVQLMNAALFRFQLAGQDQDRLEFQQTSRELMAILVEAKRSSPDVFTGAMEALERFLTKSDELLEHGIKNVRKNTAAEVGETLASNAAPMMRAAEELQKREESLGKENLERLKRLRMGAGASALGLLVATGLAGIRICRSHLQPRTEREERLVTMGTLAAGIAHEVRNPLTAIKFRLFSLSASLGSAVSANEDFQLIRREVDRLERIVQDFLSLARPAEPRLSRVEAGAMLKATRNLLTPELSKRSIAINIDSGEPIDLAADSDQIQQVLINLAQNAADSMQDGGSITLRARKGAASLGNRSQPVAMLEVTDTGSGIPPGIEQKVFDPFMTTKEGGAGLGLSIAARIVEKHGGLIQYATHPGHGTTFTVLLPREQNGSANSTN